VKTTMLFTEKLSRICPTTFPPYVKVTTVFERKLSCLMCENYHDIYTKVTEGMSNNPPPSPPSMSKLPRCLNVSYQVCRAKTNVKVTMVFERKLSCMSCENYHNICTEVTEGTSNNPPPLCQSYHDD